MLWRKVRKITGWARPQRGSEIYPDEIFLDARNLPDLDTHQFEGRFEKPISRWSMRVLVVLFCGVGAVFVVQAWTLQVARGEAYREQSEQNRLRHVEFFAERGIIYDRNGTELVWNEFSQDEEFARRRYIEQGGFSHLLGFVDYPSRDSSGFYYRTAIEGRDGVERSLDSYLRGQNGVRIIEIDALGEIQSASVLEPPLDGRNAELVIDAEVQAEFSRIIASTVEQVGFRGGAGVIMDVESGELLALTSYPDYVLEMLDSDANNSTSTPFLNRAISGLYIPGSIIKPFMAAAALEESIVEPDTAFISTGQLVVANPYDPANPSIFKDWRAHGRVDLRRALAVSSNVYFYHVGGGYGAQKGLGIEMIEKYLRMFGFGAKSGVDLAGEVGGVIPNKQWKAENYEDGLWRLGDTYNTSIGQYGMQVTPLQAARATAAVANGGILVVPRVAGSDADMAGLALGRPQTVRVNISEEHLVEVRAGMRMAVEHGTAAGLNMSAVKIAAKTGTAQVNRQFDNAWVIGFFPYENPRYSFAVTLERGPSGNLIGGVSVMRRMMEWMAANKPEYLSPQRQ